MPRASLWRNVLRYAGPAVLAIGVIVFIVARFTGQGETEKALPAAPGATPVAAKADQKALTPEIRQVANKFILSVVAGKNYGAAWDVTDPTYPGKSDYTKASWTKAGVTDEGLPVVPTGYPFKPQDVRLSVKNVYPGGVDLEAIIIPRNTARVQTFDMSLKDHGAGAKRRWLVDYWMTAYTPGFRAEPK
jgi:hypothetical protein